MKPLRREGPLGRAHVIAEERVMDYRDGLMDYDIDNIRAVVLQGLRSRLEEARQDIQDIRDTDSG